MKSLLRLFSVSGFTASLIFSLSVNAEVTNHSSYSNDEIERLVATKLKQLSLQQKVGQMVQAEIKSVTPKDVSQYGLGSILNGGGSFPNGNKTSTLNDWVQVADDFYTASLKQSKGSAGIPIIWGTDAVHGHSNVVGATLFPHNIGLGAANDPELIQRIGAATALEVLATGIDWVFAPTVAVTRDNRWGRTYEGFSDQAEIVEQYATTAVQGLQGVKGDTFLNENHLIATAKHFIGDGGTHRGVDQGNAILDEATLLAMHGRGYTAAIEAGVQTVMASFNSWNGKKLHGHQYLLTDVLKTQMGFDGFVISDWNGHGQVAGCSNVSCAQAINAGVDMIMAPEDWRELISNTIKQVNSGEIPQARIDDAVTRILRVKYRAGIMDKALPSKTSTAFSDVVGSQEHRQIAREAVRKSLVLLKNDQNVLPLTSTSKVLVVGSGANDVGQQSGGWTITWQGRDNVRADFPGATSIYEGLAAALSAGGGTASLSEDGSFETKPDVAVVVFGETPYAEGQGDIETLDYQKGLKTDLALLKKLKAKGIPIVSVFLTGRPLWMNAELNASDAFVVAWLPGSEGGGVADLLVADKNKQPRYDFTGRLSYAWPNAEVNAVDADLAVTATLFDRGYGLDYQAETQTLAQLNETPIAKGVAKDRLVFKGGTKIPWSNYVGDPSNWMVAVAGNYTETAYGHLSVTAIDRLVQEDSLQLKWEGKKGRPSQFYWQSTAGIDLSGLREQGAISMILRVDRKPKGKVTHRMDCGYPCLGEVDITKVLRSVPEGQWFNLNIGLSCFENAGTDLSKVNSPLVFVTERAFGLSISEVGIVRDPPPNATVACPLKS